MITSKFYANGSNLACHYIVTELTEETLREAKDTFFLYKEKGVILNENFSDCEWLLTNQTKKYKLRFYVSEVLYNKNIKSWSNWSYQCFIDVIKSYSLFILVFLYMVVRMKKNIIILLYIKLITSKTAMIL